MASFADRWKRKKQQQAEASAQQKRNMSDVDRMIEEIKEARIGLMQICPFFGSQCLYFDIVPAEFVITGGIPTMATDGFSLFFHPDLYKLYSRGEGLIQNKKQLMAAVAHEILHCDFAHRLREGLDELDMDNMDIADVLKVKIKHELWNKAADYAINIILKDMGFEINEHWCCDEKYRGMSAERIFHELLKEMADKMPSLGLGFLDDMSGGGGGSGSQCGDSGSQSGQRNRSSGSSKSLSGQGGKQDEDRGNQGGKGKGQSQDRSEMEQWIEEWFNHEFGKNFDRHIVIGKRVVDTKTGRQEDVSEDIVKGNQFSWENRAIYAADEHKRLIGSLPGQKGRGDLPGMLQELIDEIKTPPVPIKHYLESFMKQRVVSNPNWRRPNRRWLHRRIYLPTFKDKTIRLVFVLDTSSSISTEEAGYFLGCIKDVISGMPVDKIRYIECDEEIPEGRDMEMTKEEFLRRFDVDICRINGRGGTSFIPPFKRLEEEHCIPDALIYLTDGDGDFPDKKPPYPVLWVYSHDAVDSKPPFGELIRITERELRMARREKRRAQQSSSFAPAPGI